jgi:hypothetical protein
MNKIKAILFAIVMVFSMAMSAQNTITATEAHFTINNATTREGLLQLRNDLKAQGYDFRYQPQFDNQRHILSISFKITANDGALLGEGGHTSLNNSDASITIHINKTAGTFSTDKVGETSGN